MRKLHVRSGVPQEFWDFSALAASDILGMTRNREHPVPGRHDVAAGGTSGQLRYGGGMTSMRIAEPEVAGDGDVDDDDQSDGADDDARAQHDENEEDDGVSHLAGED